MPAAINPSTFTSLVRFLQNIGLILGMDSNKLDGDLEKFAKGLASFANRVFDYLPYFPDMDVRIRLIAVVFVIPLAADVLFIWFSHHSLVNLAHLLAIAGVFLLFYESSALGFADGTAVAGSYAILPISIVMIAGVIAYELWSRKRGEAVGDENDIRWYVDQIASFFTKPFIPNTECQYTKEELMALIASKNKSLLVKPARPNVVNMTVIGVIALGLLFVILYAAGVLTPDGASSNPVFKWGLISIGILFFIILIIVTIMLFVADFRETFVSIRKTLRRLLLKIILLILDCLYIPICQAIMDSLTSVRMGCPAGEYLNWERLAPTYFEQFMDENVSCFACANETLSGACVAACSGSTVWHSNFSQQLTLNGDVLGVGGPALIWAGLGIVIGMPILWLYLIIKNRDIAWSIPVFGETSVDKWTKLSEQLNSPGVFLFYQYMGDRWYWGMVLPVTKIIAVVLTEISNRVNQGVAYLLFISYAAVMALTLYFRPYRFAVNNWLDILMAGSSMLLTIVPICSFHSAVFPAWLLTPFTIVMCVGPLLAIPYSFIRKDPMDHHDVTKAVDDEGNDVEAIAEDMEDDVDIVQFLSIWAMGEVEENAIIGDGESTLPIMQNEKVHIHVQEVQEAYHEMYALIDEVCDAETTLQLTSVLKIAVLISTAAAGFFFGGVAGQRRIVEELVC
jgi:hypothetical protein